jgi:valyl-tRNA synthetase
MENIRDWCISRQLWWGHRIPVFYCDSCGWTDALEDDPDCCPQCGAAIRQDADVLDTWFSSQLWPFATFGWPSDAQAEKELAAYYPTQVLSTARDIIFLWVARKVMSSMYFLDGQIPFEDVIIHPTVLDKFGNIMSKSRGNGIDPLELIERFGADVMRFGLAAQVTGSQDMKFDAEKLSVYRNFATKIFNAARFVQMNLDGYVAADGRVQPAALTDADRWILTRLARVASIANDVESRFEFGVQTKALYGFFWNEFCDWYIELSKTQLAGDPESRQATQQNLVYVLDIALRLLHPYMPFLTEQIWLELPHGDTRPSLMVALWPEDSELTDLIDVESERSIDLLCRVTAAVRSTRARYRISPKQALNVSVRCSSEEAVRDSRMLLEQSEALAKLAQIADFSVGADVVKPAFSVVEVQDDLEIFIVLEGFIDFDAERARLKKDLKEREAESERLQKKLQNPGFLAKAAAEVIARTEEESEKLTMTIASLNAQIAAL